MFFFYINVRFYKVWIYKSPFFGIHRFTSFYLFSKGEHHIKWRGALLMSGVSDGPLVYGMIVNVASMPASM
jgi:hypothetical protein